MLLATLSPASLNAESVATSSKGSTPSGWIGIGGMADLIMSGKTVLIRLQACHGEVIVLSQGIVKADVLLLDHTCQVQVVSISIE